MRRNPFGFNHVREFVVVPQKIPAELTLKSERCRAVKEEARTCARASELSEDLQVPLLDQHVVFLGFNSE